MELSEFIENIKNSEIPQLTSAALSAVEPKINTISKQQAENIIHKVTDFFNIKKPILITNAPTNEVTSINNKPVIAVRSPIQHLTLLQKLEELIRQEKPIPHALFTAGLISSLPVGLLTGLINPENTILKTLPIAALGASTIPSLYQNLSLHKLIKSPYTDIEIINMGKFLLPALIGTGGVLLGRSLKKLAKTATLSTLLNIVS